MRVKASDSALEFIAEHGGKLYVWTDDVGFGHASPMPPAEQIDWVEYDEGGFTLYEDRSIVEPGWWRVEFHHLPHKHVTAIFDGGRMGGQDLYPDADADDI
jgi:hypothetical protein